MYMVEILPGSVAKGKMDARERRKEKWSFQTNVAEKKGCRGEGVPWNLQFAK
jgi:hypothetical protein